jgi:UDPglucose 6-dehydrogenase
MTLDMPGTLGGAKIIFADEIADNYITTKTMKEPKMFNRPKVGIVGLGFVGSAIKDSMEHDCDLILVDPPKGLPGKYEDLLDCEGIFVCVPSPQDEDGSCDTSYLESALDTLSALGYTGVVISKSTAPPSVYKLLQAKHKNLVHAPEFLTAANASKDYANGKFAIIGGAVGAYQREAERIIRWGQSGIGNNVQFCTIEEASLAKYTINTFLATKVAYMNEIYNLAFKEGMDYNKISNMIRMDERIGNSHLRVPGPDGVFGFGGACFPKDTSALLKYADEKGVSMMVLDAAVRKNTLLRLTEPK